MNKKSGDATIENLYKLNMGMVLICGVTNSGKNFVLDRLAQTMIYAGVYRIYVFSGTTKVNSHGYRFTEHCRPINFDRIEALFKRQTMLKAQYDAGEISECRHIAVILDDFVGSEYKLNEKQANIIARLATSGRHIHTTLVCLSQLLTAVPPTIRNQTLGGLIMITKLNKSSIEMLYDYQSEYETPKDLYRAFIDNMTKYSLMIISGDQYNEHVHFCTPVTPIDEFEFPNQLEVEPEGEELEEVKETSIQQFPE